MRIALEPKNKRNFIHMRKYFQRQCFLLLIGWLCYKERQFAKYSGEFVAGR